MITIEKLNSFGVDTAEGLERCFGNEALYLKLVTTIPDDATFERLEKKVRRYIRLLSRLPNSCAIARKWITAHFWSNFLKNEMSSASFVLNKNSQ